MLFATSIQNDQLLARVAFGLSTAAAIFGLVGMERTGRLRIPQPLLFLGSASYAVYLIHGFVLSMTMQAATRLLPRTTPLVFVLVLVVAVAVAGGCLFHVYVERALTARLRRLFLSNRVTDGALAKEGSA